MKFTHGALIALAFTLMAQPAVAFKAESLSRAAEKRLENLLLNHRCGDGKTVAQLIASAKVATSGGFISRGVSLSYNGDGRVVGVSVDYLTSDDSAPGNEMSISWHFTANRSAVVPNDETALIMALGAKPFYYYMNRTLKDQGARYNAARLKDFSWLSMLPAKGYSNGVAGLVTAKGIRVTEVQMGAFPQNPSALSLQVFFDRNGYTDLHADWVKESYRKPFKPTSGWSENFTNNRNL